MLVAAAAHRSWRVRVVLHCGLQFEARSHCGSQWCHTAGPSAAEVVALHVAGPVGAAEGEALWVRLPASWLCCAVVAEASTPQLPDNSQLGLTHYKKGC